MSGRNGQTSWRALVGIALAAAVIGAGSLVATAVVEAEADNSGLVTTDAASTADGPRVLLIGDSIMDQEGNHAAYLLRQRGADASAVAVWGSGLLTREQYDYGKSIPTPVGEPQETHWLSKARDLVAEHDPDVVAVSMNHNYFPPHPRDAAGNDITNLRSAAGQQMIQTQVRQLIEELRAGGATVLFVNPVPDADSGDPLEWSPIWSAYKPVLDELDVGVIDIASAIAGPDGRRLEETNDCDGTLERVRPENDLHLTRFGAGVAGTALADQISAHLGLPADGNAAPGDRTVALVATPTGEGYWLIGCDGSVYHHGDAAAFNGVSGTLPAPVVGATAAPGGLWLVAADGTVTSIGGAPPRTLDPAPTEVIVAVAGTSDGEGIIAVTTSGTVHVAGSAVYEGELSLGVDVVGVAAQADLGGYWILTADGGVASFGTAHAHGTAKGAPVASTVSAIAASDDGEGYSVTLGDGGVLTFGDATFTGDALRKFDPALPEAAREMFSATPYPRVVAMTRQPGAAGSWILQVNGKVHAIGGAPDLGGSGALAMFTD